MADQIILKRIKDHNQAAVAADVAGSTTQIPIDDAGYSEGKIINALELTKAVADIADSNTTAGVPATRDGTGKIPASQLPASADVAKGDWDADNSTLGQLSDGTGTAGWYYDVVDANGGTIDQGAGTLAINGASVAVGDRIKYDGANWFLIPQVANIFNGSSTEDQAAAAGDYHRKGAADDRQLSKAPSDGLDFTPSTATVEIPDNALLSFGDGTTDKPFSISAIVEIDDFTTQTFSIMSKMSGSYEWWFFIDGNGYPNLSLWDNSVSNTLVRENQVALEAGKRYHLVGTYDGGGLAGGIKLYINAVEAASYADVSVGSYVAMHNTVAQMEIGEGNNVHSDGRIYSCVLWNRELSASEVATLSRNGNQVPIPDQWAGATATSGLLTVGKRYRITTFVAGDDFTNVGAGSNATGVEFIATGTTPTTWTNSSTLTAIGAIADYAFDSIDAVNGVLPDRSSKGLNGAITDATKVREDRGIHIDAASPAADEKLLTVSVGGSEKLAIDEDGTIRQENLATDAPVAKYAADAITTAGTVSHQIPIDIGGTTYYLVAHTHGA